MHDEHPHHLLAQLPLTVSPFLSLPTATTLPYTYKQLPSTLPPSAVDPAPANTNTTDPSQPQSQPQATQAKSAYVISSSGHVAHPDDIIASCRALQAHLLGMEQEAKRKVEEWEERRREAELAEKRRVAPGWLDENVRLLVPERKAGAVGQEGGPGAGIGGFGAGQIGPGDNGEMNGFGHGEQMEGVERAVQSGGDRAGEELDRAFGGLGIR